MTSSNSDTSIIPSNLSGLTLTFSFPSNSVIIHINWETGSTLGLVIGIDEFKVFGDGK